MNPEVGARVLAAVDPDDHIEIVAEAAVEFHSQDCVVAAKLTREGTAPFIAVRTMRRWILAERAIGAVVVFTGPGRPGLMASSTKSWPNVGCALACTADDGREVSFKVFSENEDVDQLVRLITNGAANEIMLLPEHPEVPALPELDGAATSKAATAQRLLPSDWRTSEEIATAHMRALGFSDAELTGGNRDGGLDVVSRAGVAQVKMQAMPVGSPLVRQLRGARPHTAHHLFYSTSGYTTAACEAAKEAGVSLFTIRPDGTISPVGDAATELADAGVHDPDVVQAANVRQIVGKYVQDVVDRIGAAIAATDLEAPGRTGRYSGHHDRAVRYLIMAWKKIEGAPREFTGPSTSKALRSAAIYYHHTELMAHVWFREMGVSYPGGDGRQQPDPDTLDSFYN
ncbi:restriction endonuclease [Micromonospora sp. Llam7]|uniref:restriction endonuclease n=1 Tax=Micromonospora tarapacensis TaxID=2835305 RepID=UPI001C83EB7D|nr:restriction endonuclease [Micromonospora tarapacensis]MBX7264634.1 restriction endonuclease [Micromonospora tarapacensis]